MSAFIVHPDHVIALAAFAARTYHGRPKVDIRYLPKTRGIWAMEMAGNDAMFEPEMSASILANILARENVRSMTARYPNDEHDMPANISVLQRHIQRPLPPVWILKMCDCLEYQSCETDDWQETAACELLNAIRRAAINDLDGYNAAPWAYDEDWTRRISA